MDTPHDIRDVIAAAGGEDAIAAKIGRTAWAVQKWPRLGIPERHWAELRDLNEALTPDLLHRINQNLRTARAA